MGFSQKKKTLADVLNDAAQGLFDRVLALVKIGRMLNPAKVTVSGMTAASAVDITAIDRSVVTINQGLSDLEATDALPPIQSLIALRVTASGTGASLGTYILTDSGGTAIIPPGGANAAVGIATLSDDGKTITFPNTVTGFVLEYLPRAATDLETAYKLN